MALFSFSKTGHMVIVWQTSKRPLSMCVFRGDFGWGALKLGDDAKRGSLDALSSSYFISFELALYIMP